VSSVELVRGSPIAYREVLPAAARRDDAVVLLHGFPESSRMWIGAMEALAGAGFRCLAPDLYALGDSRGFGAATFEHSLERFGEWIDSLDLERLALVVHDWGGFVGLAWACENPARIASLAISDTGFFADGKWHGMAEALRGDGGEQLIDALDRDGFTALLNSSDEIFDPEDVDAYWEPFADGRGQVATLQFYRSMDFEKLAPYEGGLAAIGAPTLLLWGRDDPFAPLAGAKRLEREIPGSELVALDAGHFVFDERPRESVEALVGFLSNTP